MLVDHPHRHRSSQHALSDRIFHFDAHTIAHQFQLHRRAFAAEHPMFALDMLGPSPKCVILAGNTVGMLPIRRECLMLIRTLRRMDDAAHRLFVTLLSLTLLMLE